MGEGGRAGPLRLTRSEWVLLLVLGAMQFTHIIDFVIVMPLGPKLETALTIDADQFTWVVAAYGLSAGATGLLAAKLLDRFDRKKSLLVLFTGFMFGTLLCALAPDFRVLVLGRAVAGGFAGIMGANVLAVVADVFPESRRATAMGVVMSSFSVANIVGIYAGLEIAERFGWRAPFAVLAVLCLPALALAWRVLPPLRHHLRGPRRQSARLRDVLLKPTHLRAYALTAALILGSWSIYPDLAIYLVKNLRWPEPELRWIWLSGGVVTLLTMTPTGWLADRIDKLLVFRVIGVVSVVPVLVLTNMPPVSLAVTLLVTTLFMVCTNIRWVPGMALITASATPQERGSFMSVNSSVQQIVMALASKVSGLLLVERMVKQPDGTETSQLSGFPLVGLVAAASMIAGVYLAGRLRRAPGAPPVSAKEEVAEAALSEAGGW